MLGFDTTTFRITRRVLTQQHLVQTRLLEHAPGSQHVDLPTKLLGGNPPMLEA
jgi:hypothetical protein